MEIRGRGQSNKENPNDNWSSRIVFTWKFECTRYKNYFSPLEHLFNPIFWILLSIEILHIHIFFLNLSIMSHCVSFFLAIISPLSKDLSIPVSTLKFSSFSLSFSLTFSALFHPFFHVVSSSLSTLFIFPIRWLLPQNRNIYRNILTLVNLVYNCWLVNDLECSE